MFGPLLWLLARQKRPPGAASRRPGPVQSKATQGPSVNVTPGPPPLSRCGCAARSRCRGRLCALLCGPGASSSCLSCGGCVLLELVGLFWGGPAHPVGCVSLWVCSCCWRCCEKGKWRVPCAWTAGLPPRSSCHSRACSWWLVAALGSALWPSSLAPSAPLPLCASAHAWWGGVGRR